MKLLVKEININSHIHIRKWIVDIDEGTDFNYLGRKTTNAFFYNTKDRNKNKNKNLLYVARSLEEAIEMGLKVEKDITALGSMWEFYNAIGYDYKTKKYKEI